MSSVNANATQSTEMWYNHSMQRTLQDKSPDWNMCLYSGLIQPPPPSLSNQLCIPSYKALVHATHAGENLNLLIGQDTFFGDAGQAITYMPPLPPSGPIPATVLRTHVHMHNPNLRDTFFGINGEPPTYQPPPNPIVLVPTIKLRQWLQSSPLNLLAQDLLFGAAGEVPAYTWTVPIGYIFPIALRTFLSELKQNLIGQDTILGVAGQPAPMTDFRNPQIVVFPYQTSHAIIDEPPPLVIIVPPVVVPPVVTPPSPPVVVVAAKGINEVELGYALIRRSLELFRDN